MPANPFRKTDKNLRTPPLLKVGVVLAGWFYLSGLTSHITLGHRAAMHADPGRWFLGFAINAVGLAMSVALWNMKRWAALGLVLLALVSIGLTSALATHPMTIAALRLVPLIPAAVYWKRLAWT